MLRSKEAGRVQEVIRRQRAGSRKSIELRAAISRALSGAWQAGGLVCYFFSPEIPEKVIGLERSPPERKFQGSTLARVPKCSTITIRASVGSAQYDAIVSEAQ